MSKRSSKKEKIHWVVGLDLSDRRSTVCRMDPADREIVERSEISTTWAGVAAYFDGLKRSRVALEVGTHSPWISRQLQELGHEVIVGNPVNFRASLARRKSDRSDAEGLCRLAAADPLLLHPIQHRSANIQQDLAVLRARQGLVRTRTALINLCRGQVKALGQRVPSCSADAFASRASAALPEDLRPALEPVVETIADLTRRLREMKRTLENLAQERYPQTQRLQQVRGVGPLTALAFLLILEDPHRFPRPRQVGAYLGLTPGRSQSGNRDPGLPITKQGDVLLRQLLVQSAHYILGPFGEDCDLRRFGQRLMDRGGAGAYRRAIVAVARRLAVLLLHLWRTGDDYDPFFVEKRQAAKAA